MSPVGIGYDSHRFGEGRPLILGGVEVEHRARARGSLRRRRPHPRRDRRPARGRRPRRHRHDLFPDDDERWRDADSIDMLRTVVGMISGRIVNIDATVDLRGAAPGAAAGGDGADPRRGDLGPGQRQGDDQRGDGLDRPRRGNRLHSGRFGGERIVFRFRMGSLSSIGSSVRKTVADKAFVVEGHARRGNPRPDAPRRRRQDRLHVPALGPLAGDRRRDRRDPLPGRDRDHRRARLAHLRAAAPPQQRPRPRLRADGDRLRRRDRGDVPQPPRLHRDRPPPPPRSAPARST